MSQQLIKFREKGFTLISKACDRERAFTLRRTCKQNLVKVQRGFTLIEILVGVSVIGALAAIALISFTGPQKSAKDIKRKEDIKNYLVALELYYNQNDSYPVVSGTVPLSSICGQIGVDDCPDDPMPAQQYQYQTDSIGAQYAVWTALEDEPSYWAGCSSGVTGNASTLPTDGNCIVEAPGVAPPSPAQCSEGCTVTSECEIGLECSSGFCRNPSCFSDADCVCDALPPPSGPYHIAVVNPASDGAYVSSQDLTRFESVAWNENVGTSNGNGVTRVHFLITGPGSLTLVNRYENIVGYCAFGSDAPCDRWDGTASVSWSSAPAGLYTIESFAEYSDGGTSNTIQQTFTTSPPAGSSTITLNPAADAFVRKGDAINNNADKNYGTRTELEIDGTGSAIRDLSYLKFDLASLSGFSILDAKLRIRITNSSGNTQTIKHVDDNTWIESGSGGITFNNRPSPSGTINTFPGGSSGNWIEIDMTAAVDSKVGQTLSFLIDQTGTNGFDFNSRESSNDPELIITYQ